MRSGEEGLVAEHVATGAVGQYAPFSEDHDALREAGNQVDRVGGRDQRGAVRDQLAKGLAELELARWIEARRRLVEQQQPRRHRERSREASSLLFAEAQGFDVAFAEGRESKRVQARLGAVC